VGIHFKDTKLVLVSSLVIIMVIVSGFGYSLILQEKTRTGGMGEKWEMAVSDSYMANIDAVTPSGGMLFTDVEHHQISLVDRDGAVAWSHKYGTDLFTSRSWETSFY
jgi:hypothetical protein